MKCKPTIMPDLGTHECKEFYYQSPADIGEVVKFIDPDGNEIIGEILDFKTKKDGTITYKIKKQ